MYEELLRPRGCIAGPARHLTLRDARLRPLAGAAVAAGQLDLGTEIDLGKIKELLWCQIFYSGLQASGTGESARTPDRASQQLAWTQAGPGQHVSGTSGCFHFSTMHCGRFAGRKHHDPWHAWDRVLQHSYCRLLAAGEPMRGAAPGQSQGMGFAHHCTWQAGALISHMGTEWPTQYSCAPRTAQT
jgi:hypothetical protein